MAHIDNPLALPASSSDVSVIADESTPLHQHDTTEYGSASRPALRPAAWAHTFPRSEHGRTRRNNTVAETSEEIFAGGHHRHEERGSHAGHHGSTKTWRGWFGLGDEDHEHEHHSHSRDEEDGGRSERRKAHREEEDRAKPPSNGHAPNGSERGHGHGQRHGGHVHSHGHVHMDMERWSPERDVEDALDGPQAKVGMRRQVISILVSDFVPPVEPMADFLRAQMLEIGIMIHSLVIGLTLAITSGPEFSESPSAQLRLSQSTHMRRSIARDRDRLSPVLRGPVARHPHSDAARCCCTKCVGFLMVVWVSLMWEFGQ